MGINNYFTPAAGQTFWGFRSDELNFLSTLRWGVKKNWWGLKLFFGDQGVGN